MKEPPLTEYDTTEPVGRPDNAVAHDAAGDVGVPRIDYAERRRQRVAEQAALRASQSRRRVPLIVGGAVVGLVAVLVLADVAMSLGKIHPGVSVSGVDVGGMAPAKAASVLQTRLPEKTTEPVVVVHGDDKWTVKAKKIGLTFDYDALAQDAMDVGRSDSFITTVSDRVEAWFGGTDLDATASADEDQMSKLLDEIAEKIDVDPVDATVKIKDLEPTVVSSEEGVTVRTSVLKSEILSAMLSTDRTVDVPTQVAKAEVTDAEAKRAAEIATTMLSGPVTVSYKSKDWEFEPDDIAKWIVFKRSDDSELPEAVAETVDPSAVTLVTYVSPKKAGKTVSAAVGTKVGHAAKDASFSTSAGRVRIIPSENGVGPDMDDLATSLTTSLSSADSSRSVAMRTAVTEPDITTEEAEKMGINERLSRFTTTYASTNTPRVANIHLLGDALDGTLVAPGKTFSFNGAVGERTAEKGYQEAGAIVNGELVPQLGGGICQVGTTIFNAVFESGLPVVERRNHSFYISHYPKGRDATVSWGGPDFKFKNDTDNWVLVSVSYTSTSITVAIYGTDPGYEVEAKTGDWKNVKKYSTKEIKDKTLSKGTRVVEDAGVEGKTITVKRIVSKDGKVIRTDSFTSVYKPKTEVVRVGTKEKKKDTDTTTDEKDAETTTE